MKANINGIEVECSVEEFKELSGTVPINNGEGLPEALVHKKKSKRGRKPNKIYQKITKEDINEAVRLKNNGKSAKQVANLLGRTRDSIYSMWRTN